MGDEAGLELRAHHVVALAADRPCVEEALAAFPKRRRPKVKPEHQATSPHDEKELTQIQHGRGSADDGTVTATEGTKAIKKSEEAQLGDFASRDVSDRIGITVERTFVHFRESREASECSAKAN